MIPKFRAWSKLASRMYIVNGLYFDSGMVQYANNDNAIRFIKLENIILMQSTGLFDKNGKEIFDGDIVKRYRSPFFKAEWEYQIETVVKREACLLLEKKFGRNSATMSFGSPFAKSDLLEVVGNIYENPELLEVKR
ncbi:YopX protein [Streptococcus sp. A12]|uniref:YopX family protein n=1 Tax=Streptococcus sp. A12 TaxID=1759399 RepID=UPI000F678323|nr:YopX family protein [Streptococcus sp. A12]RSK01654.1 YopX protein [Streptococcus sp. A12]